MLPGKKFTPEDILRIGWRRKWLILVPFVTVTIATVAIAWFLPNRYQSTTTILIVPQRVPDTYVRSTVASNEREPRTVRDRVEALKPQILSRTRLERLILDLNLYAKDRQALIMEDVVQRMRKDIDIQPALRGDSFQLAFTYGDRRLAMDVVNRIAAAFIDESNQDRTLFAESTTSFLETQLADSRQRLEELEKRVADYKMRHAGELPTEREANLQVLSSMQMQVQANAESINRDRDRRYLLERTLSELSTETPPPPPAQPAAQSSEQSAPAGRTAAEQLEAARADLRRLELRFTPDHPDVRRARRIVGDLEVKAQQEALQKPLSGDVATAAPQSLAEQQRQGRMRDLRLEIEGIDRVIATKAEEDKALRGKIAEYQRRVEATPARESELTSLLRDYATVQQNYSNLLAKQEDSKIAANLERRQIGEQFRTLDQARLPERPISPNRPLIDLAGAVAGLAIGLGLVALLEYGDNSFRTDDEIVRVLSLPVVAMIPVMLSKAERKSRRRRSVILGVATGIVFLVGFAGAAWFFLLRG